jgi:hypothetical protein
VGLFGVSCDIWTAEDVEELGCRWREVVSNRRGKRSRRDSDGKLRGIPQDSCAPSGLALNDWVVREMDATAVTSDRVRLWSQNQGHARFDRDQTIRFPSHARPDSCLAIAV